MHAIRSALQTLTTNADLARRGYLSWGAVWDTVKEINALFRHTCFKSNDDRTLLWQEFQSIIVEMRQLQDLDRDRLASASAVHVDRILWHVSAVDIDISPGTVAQFIPDHRSRKEQLQSASEGLKSAWNELSGRKPEMTRDDKQQVFDRLKDIQDRLNAAWDQFRGDSQQRQEDWHQRTVARIEKSESFLSNLYELLRKAEANLEKNQEMHDSARNDDRRDRVAGWIGKTESRIDSLKAKIRDVEEQIQEAKDRLR